MAEESKSRIVYLANSVLSAWDYAMDRFFEVVEEKGREQGLTDEEIRTALNHGYGYEVGDAWADWIAVDQ